MTQHFDKLHGIHTAKIWFTEAVFVWGNTTSRYRIAQFFFKEATDWTSKVSGPFLPEGTRNLSLSIGSGSALDPPIHLLNGYLLQSDWHAKLTALFCLIPEIKNA
jgi:hypothetical protein